MKKIISIDKSIIPACDVSLEKFEEIVIQTADIEKVGGYKIPATSGLEGWVNWVDTARMYTNKPLIYDHQKAATDVPYTAKKFMECLSTADFDAVILFPQAGPVTEYEWIKAAQDNELGVIVGGEMTHPRYLEGDLSNEKEKDYTKIFADLGFNKDLTGFIRPNAPEYMYELAARMGVTDFIVPGNKPNRIVHYKALIEHCGVTNAVYYLPGFATQGGDITESSKVAGERFHAIIGREIYEAKDIRQATLDLASKL